MTQKKSESVLTEAAKAIGTTLGNLAAKTGLASPDPAPVPKKKTPGSAKKAAPKKPIKKVTPGKAKKKSPARRAKPAARRAK